MRFIGKISGEHFIVEGDELKHLLKSMRLKTGDEFVGVDFSQTDYFCEITSIYKNSCVAKVTRSEKNLAEPKINVTLYQAYPKADKLEFVLQKAIELGVCGFVPFISNRCVKRPEKINLERFNKIANDAVKQCERNSKINISDVLSFDEVLKKLTKHQAIIFCYEGEKEKALREINFENFSDIALIIGSEGGFEQTEAQAFIEAGALCVSLGKRILRAETAGLCALSYIMQVLYT